MKGLEGGRRSECGRGWARDGGTPSRTKRCQSQRGRASAKQRQFRRRQRARARRTRRQLQAIEQVAPSILRRPTQAWRSAFTRLTYYRIVVLLLAAPCHPGQSHHSQCAADHRCVEHRSCVQLSSRLLALALVDLAARAPSGAVAHRASFLMGRSSWSAMKRSASIALDHSGTLSK